MRDRICPICGGVSLTPYTRKRKCTYCAGYVYYRSKYGYIFNRNVHTLSGAALIDYYTYLAELHPTLNAKFYRSKKQELARQYDGVVPHPETIVFAISEDKGLFELWYGTLLQPDGKEEAWDDMLKINIAIAIDGYFKNNLTAREKYLEEKSKDIDG